MSSAQKWTICIVIALLCFLPSSNGVTHKVNLSAEETEAYGFAGLFAYMSVAIATPDDQPTPVAECKCNKGTGKISYDGGGSLTDCPCKDGTCDCGCVNSKKKASGDAVEPPKEVQIKKKRTILVTDPIHCQPCRGLDSGLLAVLKNDQHKKAGWVIDNTENATLQVLDINKPEDIAEIERLGLDFTAVPTFIRYNSDTENISGNISYEEFLRFREGGNKIPFYKSRTKIRWHIDGNYSPSKDKIIAHLRRDKDHSVIASWPLEILSKEDLLSLHSDIHNGDYGKIEWRDR